MCEEDGRGEGYDPIHCLRNVRDRDERKRATKRTQLAVNERLAAPARVLGDWISETYTRKPMAQVALKMMAKRKIITMTTHRAMPYVAWTLLLA